MAMKPKHDAARGWLLSLVAALCLLFMLFDASAADLTCASPQCRQAPPVWGKHTAAAGAANPHLNLDAAAHAGGLPP
jgi:hypothetical protein